MSSQARNQRRADILSAALTEFREMGYERAKIEEIARAAGIGKSTVYEYFSSKDDLLVAVLHEGLERLNLLLSEMLDSPAPLRQTLTELLGRGGRSLCNSVLPLTMLDVKNCPAAAEFLRANGDNELRVVLGLLEQRVHRAIEEGEVRGDLDAHFAAGMTFSLMMATGNQLHRSDSDQNGYAKQAVNLLFEGIGPR